MNKLQTTTLTPAEALAIRQAKAAIQRHQLRRHATGSAIDKEAKAAIAILENYIEKYENQPVTV